MGWTGLQTKRKLMPLVNRDGINGARGASSKEREVAVVEIDAAFARSLGLSDGQKVSASIHINPPEAHTVHIEPLTPEDWEIIELHATFLELNLISQIRALPNPNYVPSKGSIFMPHPLLVHLSPIVAANIKITSLMPNVSYGSPFAKIAPEAEVIVAPKERSKTLKSSGGSISSRRSAGGRSGASTVRRKSAQGETFRPAIFLRGLDKRICDEWIDETDETDQSLVVWVDRDLLLGRTLKGLTWVAVTIIKPHSLQPPVDPQKQREELEKFRETGLPTSKVVARLMAWDDAPDSQYVALSSALCSSLACDGMVGGVVRIQPAPQQLPKSGKSRTDGASQNASASEPQALKVYPFISTFEAPKGGLRFGGENKSEREEAVKEISRMYGKQGSSQALLEGPITDGLILPKLETTKQPSNWAGGLLRISKITTDSGKQTCHWFLGSERKHIIEIEAPILRPIVLSKSDAVEEALPEVTPSLVAIDNLLGQLQTHLSHMSSVILTGALGSGKTSVVQLLGHHLRRASLFHTTYLSCRKLVTDDVPISTIKDSLTRIFMNAAWGARLGGRSLVILDDLDKLCPIETELEVGSENSRSRTISEIVCSIVKQYCRRDSCVVLLATAQAKESLNSVIVGGHVVREIVSLKAPDKEGRRRIMECIIGQGGCYEEARDLEASRNSTPSTARSVDESEAWLAESSESYLKETNGQNDGFVIDRNLDLLDLAGEVDGFMPGDLIQLVARARSEALIRAVSDTSTANSTTIELNRQDFEAALKGFTPASLRNVTLQTSTTTWDSIGGLHETRKILLETLQYPTTYAPIFAQCPLRLRSGLLLYGYPGCGKTLLASAVAGECGLNFISVKGPEILNKYIGASEKSVRDLFERAEAARPCVLFFDEFDSIAPKRGHDSTGVTDRVVNQLLTQMDGAEGLSGVYVLAATSRPDLIDPALLRPGRLDKSLICGLPNFDDRIDILTALEKKLKLSAEVHNSFADIAEHTAGYSGADLQALIYNAHLEAIHDILGDQNASSVNGSNRYSKKSESCNRRSGTTNFVQFLYGEEEQRLEAEARSKFGKNRSQQLAERATISAKLGDIKKMNRLAKRMAKGLTMTEAAEAAEQRNGDTAGTKENKEVTIEWQHIVKSLQTTKASISVDERRRLAAIYKEFVVGRNGEMPDGDGGREIGGRTSLM